MNNKYLKPWRRLRDRRGMMMAELLIVVAIVAVLSGVAFIGVTQYQRSLGQLERDEIAKQIFVAAQNHLTATKGTTYQTDDLGTEEGDGKYYLVYNRGDTVDAGSILRDMLPLGSIDETIRAGGNYIIRYHRQSNTVLDVFYCSSAGSPEQFNHSFFADDDSYSNVVLMADPAKKSARKTYVNKSILGWYGGASAEAVAYEEDLKDPDIIIHNDEILWVEIEDTNTAGTSKDTEKVSLQLKVVGEESGAEMVFILRKDGNDYTDESGGRIKHMPNSTKWQVVLDDITTGGRRFADLNGLSDANHIRNDKSFKPGENLSIQAIAYNNLALSNIAYSGKQTVNSLFDSVQSGTAKTARIARFRHLENLDGSLSGLADSVIGKAEQTENLVWNSDGAAISKDAGDFKHRVQGILRDVLYETAPEHVKVYVDASAQPNDCLYPVSPNYALAYNGGNHSVSKVKVNHGGDAGLFGTLQGHTFTIQNLELVDFSVNGANAGALVGSANDVTVQNVLARSSGTATATNISATGSAGGLIGSMTGGTVTNSAAALIVGEKTVNGTVIRPTTAGGLIGTTSGAATVNRCYSGGHTVNGAYDANHYNVTATGAAGGLIGDAGDAAITNSYSTCSATGATAGGFVGSASGSIEHCYATGLVGGSAAKAFIGSGSAVISTEADKESYYFSIINEILTKDGDGNVTAIDYMEPGNGSVTAFDETAQSYDGFVGAPTAWTPAMPYDDTLLLYYGKYNLPSIARLGASLPASTFASTHYGDWPAPEVFTVNN